MTDEPEWIQLTDRQAAHIISWLCSYETIKFLDKQDWYSNFATNVRVSVKYEQRISRKQLNMVRRIIELSGQDVEVFDCELITLKRYN